MYMDSHINMVQDNIVEDQPGCGGNT